MQCCYIKRLYFFKFFIIYMNNSKHVIFLLSFLLFFSLIFFDLI
uniref:Uncharacterized protein n=1 Tax=Caudovirales sp. ctIbU14 TaxID=2825761 RepID=A0A8S5NS43_9CAUD|nr:MAG TPA: hypothetical protein [Caudovirales sp. ctIbU14]